MCGASGQQKQAYSNIKSISDSLRGAFQTIFAGNMNILNNLESSLAPSIRGGPSGYGFSPNEDAARRTQATEQIAQSGAQATNAVRSSLAAQGGGNTFLPSGSEAAINAGLAQNTAQEQAQAQIGITQQGYETGRENYFQSVGLAGALPGQLENPAISAGDAAVGGGKAQEQAASDIAQANNAWIAPVAGMIGAVGGAALGKPPK